MRWSLIPIFFLSSSFVLVTDYGFVDPKRVVHLDGSFRAVGGADLKTSPYQNTQLHYHDVDGSVYFTKYVNENNSLTTQLGYYQLKVDWPENPRFTEKFYNYGVVSLGWVSHSLDGWKWIFSGALSASAHDVNLANTGVFYLTGWGRYKLTERAGLHLGVYGYAGVRNIYVLPILGVDFFIGKQWMISAVFPFDVSLRCFLSRRWHIDLAAKSFGNPYRFPQRARGGIGDFKNGIFEIYSAAGELSLNYHLKDRINFSLGGGYNLGGWLLIRDTHNHRGKYYKFGAAPYGEASLGLTF